MGSKLMNCCRPEQTGIKEYGKMLKRIQTQGDGRIAAKEAKKMRIEGLGCREIVVGVEHVKAHRTRKEKKEMSHFENFIAECNEKADELPKAGAFLDEGFMAEARAETMQQEREEVYAAPQYAASFDCMVEE